MTKNKKVNNENETLGIKDDLFLFNFKPMAKKKKLDIILNIKIIN